MTDLELIREDGRSGLWSHNSEAALKRISDRITQLESGFGEISVAKVSSFPDAMAMISHMKGLACRLLSTNADA